MRIQRLLPALLLSSLFTPLLHAGGFSAHELNIHYVNGASPMGAHGHSLFQSVEIEVTGHHSLVRRYVGRYLGRYLGDLDCGASFTYHDIIQARSWFGYRFGDPDDKIRGYQAYFFLRRRFLQGSRVEPYVELGTGPMFSNRRVPAATSRINVSSQSGFGFRLFASSRFPITTGYRFSHISDAGFTGRNPGLNVHSVVVGTRLRTFHSR
jgi:hypothetical protein